MSLPVFRHRRTLSSRCAARPPLRAPARLRLWVPLRVLGRAALPTSGVRLAAAASALAAAVLAGCAAGPDYVRPAFDAPAAYKESGPWKTAAPRLADTQAWWQIFNDETLNTLMAQADGANQNIRLAEAQYRQAHALAAQARAGFFPTLGVDAGATRARSNAGGAVATGNNVNLGLAASWEPDLWGSVRRTVEAGDANAQASADDLAGARLSIQAELAQDYLQLRVTDLLSDLYTTTIDAYTKSLKLTQSQYAAGVALRSDVALAESQLKTTQAAGVDLDATRSQLEHAIAILTGQPPAAFTLAPLDAQTHGIAQLQARLPVIPAGLPSELLERRPDIAGAERRVAAANANIGVARAAYFPSLVLNASGGFSAAGLSTLFDTPGRVWSLGATLAQTLFDGGLRRAADAAAVAAFDAAVAQYKQTVLAGFGQVEDNLAAVRILDQELALQMDAVKAAQVAERSALAQVRAGTGTYLSLITAQTAALANQRAAVQLVGRQLSASVSLITATGGGWHDVPAPSAPSAVSPVAALSAQTAADAAVQAAAPSAPTPR